MPLKPTRHIERLRVGAASCDLDFPWSDDELLKEIYNASTYIKDRGVLRLMVYRGGNLGLHSQGSTERLILLEPALNVPNQDFKEGLSVKLKMTSKNSLKSPLIGPTPLLLLDEQHASNFQTFCGMILILES